MSCYTWLLVPEFQASQAFGFSSAIAFPQGFSIIFDFDKNALHIFNSVIDKTVEQDEVRDMESPPNNGIISELCSATNKYAFRIMGSFNLGFPW